MEQDYDELVRWHFEIYHKVCDLLTEEIKKQIWKGGPWGTVYIDKQDLFNRLNAHSNAEREAVLESADIFIKEWNKSSSVGLTGYKVKITSSKRKRK